MTTMIHGSGPGAGAAAGAGRSRAVAIWLLAVATIVAAMVVVGGATRLTGSGLSITEWKPVTGAIPPLGEAAWADAFAKYRASSQYRLINQGISLADFKVLFWWEWAHRLLGRILGLVFALPLVGLIAARRLPRRLIGRCVGLFALGGLQGLAGWWMVRSGLEGRAAVAPERLAVHLGLALVLLGALVWTALDAWNGPAPAARRGGTVRAGALTLGVGVYFQCLLGALVAGGGGGRVDNDWPLMGGRLVPDDYVRGGLWNTLAHSPSATQFNHRLAAYMLLLSGVALLVALVRSGEALAPLRRLARATVGLMFVQAALGVATLWAGDPLWLALAHQANAALTLACAAALAWRARHA